MKEDLITFETAKLAKEKGFNIPTRNFFANWEDGLIEDQTIFNCSDVGYPEFTNDGLEGFGNVILIPTQSLLQKWIFSNYKFWIEILPLAEDLKHGFYWSGRIFDLNKGRVLIKSISGNGDPYKLNDKLLFETLKLIPSI